MQRLVLSWMIAGVAVCAACGDDDGDDGRPDGGALPDGAIQDGGFDAGPDASQDASQDAGLDGALPDAGPDDDAAAGEDDAHVGQDGGGIAEGPPCAADNGGIELPSGFCASVFASELGRARHLAVTPSGDVYVAIGNAPGATGRIVAMRDTDGDAVADQVVPFHDDGGNGIAWQDGMLYFAEDDRVVRYALPDGQLVPEGDPTVIVAGLPSSGDHPAKAIVLVDDALYVNIASATNSCQEANRELESPGQNPCPELDTRAGVWLFDADEVDQTLADGERYVTGARNLTAIEARADGALFAVQNGRDQLYDNWPDLYSEADDMRLPAEEMFRLNDGDDYGWPYCYYDPSMEEKVLAPEYGGDGAMVGRCSAAQDPVASYPAHWASLGLAFYDGELFPERYRDGAFIAFHGSRFSPQAQGDLPGYNVVFQPFASGAPAGDYEIFATGFAGSERPLPEQAAHRPVDVAVGPDGSLYVSDDKGGSVFRVFHDGAP